MVMTSHANLCDSINPGAIVNVVGDTSSAYVVIATFANRVQLVYCGSERWYVPKWFDLKEVVTPANVNKNSRRALRWLERAGFDPDGWRRISVGRSGSESRVAVDHVSMQES